jgi:DNA-binding HxlR family transcriptional regulator
MTSHPVNGIDDVVHQRVRLGVLTIAHQARQVEFGYLRATLELTGGNLSQHLTTLHNAGLITISAARVTKERDHAPGSLSPKLDRLRCVTRSPTSSD